MSVQAQAQTVKQKNRGKGLEFNPGLALGLVFALFLIGVGGFLLLNLTGDGEIFEKDVSPKIATLAPLVAGGLAVPVATETPVPTPTSTPMAIVGVAVDVLEYPQTGARAVGRLLAGSIVVPVGRWGDWLLFPGGWLHKQWLAEVPKDLPVVSPPMLPALPTSTPEPLPTPTVFLPPMRVYEPAIIPTPSATPVFMFRPLPAGFEPGGWCVQLAAEGVTLPDNSYYEASADGYVYLSSEVLGLRVIVKRLGWYFEYTFIECGQFR